MPETTDTAGKSRPSGARKGKAGKYLIRPENLAASNCRYGRKIQASNYQIRPENSASRNYRNGGKYQQRKIINVLEHIKQGRSGAVVEHLVHHLMVDGSCPPCAQLLFRYTAGKFRVAQKSQQKIQALMAKTFFVLCTKWVSGTRSG
jgi:hypothetical protein